MAWGRSKPQPPPSLWRQILPLIVAVLFIAGAAWVGYQIYVSINKMRETAAERMGNKNVSFSKDGGLRVGVKQVGEEKYVDSTQKWVVKAWNLANEDKGQDKKDPKQKKR